MSISLALACFWAVAANLLALRERAAWSLARVALGVPVPVRAGRGLQTDW